MDHAILKDILPKFCNKKILVVGDFYLDEYIHGVNVGFSPEAPVPRILVKEKEWIPGAASNVAVGFASMGAKVYTCGVIGDDEAGRNLVNKLLEKQVITKGLLFNRTRNTGVFSRIVLESGDNLKQHFVRFDHENKKRLEVDSLIHIKDYINSIIPQVDLIFFADYDENIEHFGVLTEEIINHTIGVAKQHGIKTVAISRKNILKFNGVDIIILNKKEAQYATGNFLIEKNEDMTQLGRKIITELGANTVVITQGKGGATLVNDSESVWIPSLARKITDVCGAGDAFSVALSLSILSGLNSNQSLEIASIAASICISKPGTADVSTEEILQYLIGNNQSKLKTMEELTEIIKKHKQNGKKIAFTNGCFDLINAGQIEFLEKAKEKGDVLILGINSDRSVRENKGPNRPILKEDERIKILSSLACLDYIIVFNELTPIKLISTLKPDLLIKGGNYTKENIIGKDILDSYNGEVVLIPINGQTTSDILNMIVEKNENFRS